MTKTGNIVAVTVLTVFIMGFANYMQQGSFIVPFPFISEFVFMMVIGILILRFKPWTRINSLLTSFAVFGVLAGRFLWETILDFDQLLYLFEETIAIDVFKILQYISVIFLIVEIIRISKNRTLKFLHGIFIFGLVCALVLNRDHFLFAWYIGYGLLCFSSLRLRKEEESSSDCILELFLGLGLIYLMSVISIAVN